MAAVWARQASGKWIGAGVPRARIGGGGLVVLAVAIGFLFAQVATEITGSLDVAVRRIEFHSAELLEMGRLGMDE
jgi:hypothetical protein